MCLVSHPVGFLQRESQERNSFTKLVTRVQVHLCVGGEDSWKRVVWKRPSSMSALLSSSPRFQTRLDLLAGFLHWGQPGWSCCHRGPHSGRHCTGWCFCWLLDGSPANGTVCSLPAREQMRGGNKYSCGKSSQKPLSFLAYGILTIFFHFKLSIGRSPFYANLKKMLKHILLCYSPWLPTLVTFLGKVNLIRITMSLYCGSPNF